MQQLQLEVSNDREDRYQVTDLRSCCSRPYCGDGKVLVEYGESVGVLGEEVESIQIPSRSHYSPLLLKTLIPQKMLPSKVQSKSIHFQFLLLFLRIENQFPPRSNSFPLLQLTKYCPSKVHTLKVSLKRLPKRVDSILVNPS